MQTKNIHETGYPNQSRKVPIMRTHRLETITSTSPNQQIQLEIFKTFEKETNVLKPQNTSTNQNS